MIAAKAGAVILGLLSTSCSPALRQAFTPPPVATWEQALLEPTRYCFNTVHGVPVFTVGVVECPVLEAVETVLAETIQRADLPADLRGVDVRIAEFQVRCAGKIVSGCTAKETIVVFHGSWTRSLRHEAGHILLERSIAPDGDPRHDLCGFWWKLEYRRCAMMGALKGDEQCRSY